MKQSTTSLMKLKIGTDITDVETVEIAFSQERKGPPIKISIYPGSGVENLGDNILGVHWEPEETHKFKAGEVFYIDTRITMKGSAYNPETEIAIGYMAPSLFEPNS